jgi:hypothetical protein
MTTMLHAPRHQIARKLEASAQNRGEIKRLKMKP